MTRIEFGNRALRVHEPFHRSSARERVMFGAVGSGKSYAICDEAIAWCLEQPGIDGLITRKTIPELRDSTEQVFAERVPADLWAAGELRKHAGHYESFTFPNGSRIRFRSIDDWRKHKSMNLGFIAWDEMAEFDAETYQGMLTRLRQVDPLPGARAIGYTDSIKRQGSWGATNPEGHDWVYRIAHPDSKERKPHVEAFFSTMLDNPYLPKSFMDDMLSMPKPWVKRYVLCQFDDFAGRIYEEFNWTEHTVDPPAMQRPLLWQGVDPGTRNPTAAVWAAPNPDTRGLVVVAEYEHHGLSVVQHVAAWREIEARMRATVRARLADPNAITQRDRGTAISLQTQYARQGYHLHLGAANRDDRILALGELIHSRRFKISRDCMRTIEAIKGYQWKDLTPAQRSSGEEPREEPLKKNTHLVEAVQFLASKQVPLTALQRRRIPKDFNAEIHDAIRRQIQAKRTGSRAGEWV